MKTQLRQILWRILFAILLTASHPAVAFFDPTAGRFVSRDPIGERGGQNLYCFNNNEPISHIDSLGLEIRGAASGYPMYVFDLGKHLPEGKTGVDGKKYMMGGLTTLTDWSTVAYPMKGGSCSANNWHVYASAFSSVEYWWADATVKAHEETHVAIWEYEWNDLVGEIGGITGRCFCSEPKARCFSNLLKSLSGMYRMRGSIKNDDFDCQAYGNQWGACDRVKSDTIKLRQYEDQIYQYRLHCEAMQ